MSWYHQRANLTEAKETLEKHFPIGAVVPFYFDNEEIPASGMVVGYFLPKDLEKSRYKIHESCSLIVFFGRSKYISSFYDEKSAMSHHVDRLTEEWKKAWEDIGYFVFP